MLILFMPKIGIVIRTENLPTKIILVGVCIPAYLNAILNENLKFGHVRINYSNIYRTRSLHIKNGGL